MSTVANVGQVPEWTITDRLRKARELTGLDQTEFADLIGVSRGTVSRYERGVETHKRPNLLAWALGSGVSFEWLVAGSESPPLPDLRGSRPTRGYDAHTAFGLGCAA